MTTNDVDAAGLTIDELARLTRTTVRTTRYYATLGLLPPPERRGRVAVYSTEHRARLDLIRALQDHGFTLAAIERYLARIPFGASVEDLAVQRAMLTSWWPGERQPLTLRQLEKRAGRRLPPAALDQLVLTGAVEEVEGRYAPLPAFEVGLGLLGLDVPLDSIVEARRAIDGHMDGLVDELTTILHKRVLAPFLASPHTEAEAAQFEQTMARLRQLTLEAVVRGFQRAADEVISRTLADER